MDAQRHKGDNVKMETEIGIMGLQTKDCWKPPEAGRSKGVSLLEMLAS